MEKNPAYGVCFDCGTELVWSGDFNYDEIYPGDIDEEKKDRCVSFYTCPGCGAEYQITH